ncbi:MAG: dTMP kinase [Candidatus Dormibacteria bacterium]
MSGYFISLEGLDGAGKSTQVAALAAWLRKQRLDVVTVRPNGTLLGELLHSFVLQHQRGPALQPWSEALLFFAERVQLLHEVIVPALDRGALVLADRYTDSTIAYQGGGRGLPVEPLLELHRQACGDIWPDLTLYLRIPIEVAVTRQHAQQLPLDRIEGAPENFHAAVAAAFEDIAALSEHRVVAIDATMPALEVAQTIADTVAARLPESLGLLAGARR